MKSFYRNLILAYLIFFPYWSFSQISNQGILNEGDNFTLHHLPENVRNENLDAIKDGLQLDLIKLNPVELSFCVEQLYQVYDKNKDFYNEKWGNYIDSLSYEILYNQNLLLSAQLSFFLKSININENLNRKYPKAFKYFLNNTPTFPSIPLLRSQYDSLLLNKAFLENENNYFLFELLVLDAEFMINEVITSNERIEHYYRNWLKGLDENTSWLTFSESKPPIILDRKQDYLSQKLLSVNSDLGRLTKKSIDNLLIFRFTEMDCEGKYPEGYSCDPDVVDFLLGSWKLNTGSNNWEITINRAIESNSDYPFVFKLKQNKKTIISTNINYIENENSIIIDLSSKEDYESLHIYISKENMDIMIEGLFKSQNLLLVKEDLF